MVIDATECIAPGIRFRRLTHLKIPLNIAGECLTSYREQLQNHNLSTKVTAVGTRESETILQMTRTISFHFLAITLTET